MKFYRKIVSIAFLVLASLLCCCSNIENNEENEEYGHVRIFLGSAAIKRTLLPVIDNNAYTSIIS